MKRRESLHLMAALSLYPVIEGMSLGTFSAPIKRAIPGTQELLPVVGLGTWETFDVTASQKTLINTLKETLATFHQHGGALIDSSPMYGFAEENVGKLSTELTINKKLFLATKVWTQGKEKGIEQMTRSLQLLQRTQLDLMQIHNLVDWQTHIKTLREWKEKGKVRYIGITHYQKDAYALMEKIIQTEAIDFIQVNYNLMDRESEERLLPLAKDKKIAVVISQPFGYGKLFQQVKDKKLPAFAAELDCKTWAQFFLKFIISHPAVTCVIPGTGNPAHMIDNMGAGSGRLPDEKQRQLMAHYLA